MGKHNRPSYKYVVAEIHPDGFVKLYGDKDICIKAVQRPVVRTVEAEALTDEYIESILPWRYRQVYNPSMVRGTLQTGNWQTPQEMAYVRWELELIESLSRMQRVNEELQKARAAHLESGAAGDKIEQNMTGCHVKKERRHEGDRTESSGAPQTGAELGREEVSAGGAGTQEE